MTLIRKKDTFDIQSLFSFNVFKLKTKKSYKYRFNVIKNPHVIIENYGILLELRADP